MTDINKIARLAELKTIIKSLTEESKVIQKELIEDGAGDKLVTEYGILTLCTRNTFECTDKRKAFDLMGTEEYIGASTITLNAVTKVAGTFRSEMFLADEVFRLKTVSKYYTLKK